MITLAIRTLGNIRSRIGFGVLGMILALIDGGIGWRFFVLMWQVLKDGEGVVLLGRRKVGVFGDVCFVVVIRLVFRCLSRGVSVAALSVDWTVYIAGIRGNLPDPAQSLHDTDRVI